MKPLSLGLDLDGVFADFNAAFIRQLIESSGRDLRPDPSWSPTVWDWMTALGYRRSEVVKAWQDVDRNPLWWATLEPYPGATQALRTLSDAVYACRLHMVFLTTRLSPTAHWQSVEWLERQFVRDLSAQVCICQNAESKGLMAKALGLDLVLDDHTPNLLAVKRHHPAATVVVFDRPWNNQPLDRAGLMALGHETVSDYGQFFDLIDARLKERH